MLTSQQYKKYAQNLAQSVGEADFHDRVMFLLNSQGVKTCADWVEIFSVTGGGGSLAQRIIQEKWLGALSNEV